MNENIISEVVEVTTKEECNRLLNTGYYIFLNCYVKTIEAKTRDYPPTQQIYYCLGKISYY